MNGSETMRDYIIDFPHQLAEGYKIGKTAEVPKSGFTSLIICGMGGSAIGGDLLLSYAQPYLRIPAVVNRGYTLPRWAGRDTLVILSSYSGGTGETLSCLEKVIENGSTLIAITTGGKLGEKCEGRCVHWIKIPGGMPPRAALGYSFAPLLSLFEKLELIDSVAEKLEETIDVLKQLAGDYQRMDSLPAELAQSISDKIPVIYADGYRLQAATTRFRCQIAENAKSLAFSNVFPELNHNEIVGWGSPDFSREKMAAIFLEDEGSSKEVTLQMNTTKVILTEIGIPVYEIKAVGESFLCRMLSLTYFGDWLSWHLAKLKGVDPVPIARIDLLKQKLSEAEGRI